MTLTLLPGYTFAKSPLSVSSMAVSANGAVMAVGYNGDEFSGCVVIYDYDSIQEVWVERNVLHGKYSIYEGYGTSVALSSEGNILVVGRSKHLGTATYGSISTYEWIDGVWVKTLYDLLPYELLSVVGFGSTISLSGDGKILVVGHYYAYNGYGCVYTYVRSGNSWNVLFPALISPAGVAHAFGLSVVVSEDGKVLIVSTRCFSSLISGFYVFDIGNTNWIQRGSIYPRTRTAAYTGTTTATLMCSANKNVLIILETESYNSSFSYNRHFYVLNDFNCKFNSTMSTEGYAVIDNNDVMTVLSTESPSVFNYRYIFRRYKYTGKCVAGKVKLGVDGTQARVQVITLLDNSLVAEMITGKDGLFSLNLPDSVTDIDVIVYKQDSSVFDSLEES